MKLANCIALSKVETRLAVHLIDKKTTVDIEPSNKKRKVRTSEKLLEKLINPETEEFYKLKCILKPISKFGQVSDITSLILLCFVLISAISSKAEGNTADIRKYNEVLTIIFKYFTISCGITLPFIVGDSIQQEISESHKWNKEKETVRLEEKQLESKTLQQALRLIKALQRGDQNFELNFARSILNNVDISENTTEYNEKLIILLSKVMEDESIENLENLAIHLDKKRKENADNASKEFLGNEVVKQLVKSYSPKRS